MRDLFVKKDIALHDRILLLLVVLNPQRLNKLPNIKRESILKNFRHTNNKLVRFFPSRIKYAKNSLAQSVRDAWLRRGKRQFLVTSICLSYLFVLAWVLQLFPWCHPGLLTNSIFFCFSLFVKSHRFASMTPHRGNSILCSSSQQLPCLRLGTLKGFLSWHSALQGPSTCLMRYFQNYRDTRTPSGVPH